MNVYFSLSRFLPISISAYHYFCNMQIRLPISFLLFGWFSGNFPSKFFQKFQFRKTKLNTKSLPKAENQTKCCKTIFQKSAESQKCSNKKKPSTKSQKWNREILISAMSSSVIQVKCFLDFSDKILLFNQKSAEKIKIISIWLLEQYWLFLDLGRLSEKGFTVSWMILADFW